MAIKLLIMSSFLFISTINVVTLAGKQAQMGELSWIDRGIFQLEQPFKQKYKNWVLIELKGAAPFYGKIKSPDGKQVEDVLLTHGKNKSSSENYGALIGTLGITGIYKKGSK